jgi:hypothetical protein
MDERKGVSDICVQNATASLRLFWPVECFTSLLGSRLHFYPHKLGHATQADGDPFVIRIVRGVGCGESLF